MNRADIIKQITLKLETELKDYLEDARLEGVTVEGLRDIKKDVETICLSHLLHFSPTYNTATKCLKDLGAE